MDPQVLIALIGLPGTILTIAGGFYMATRTNKNEKEASADEALEKAYEQRIILRDEKIVDLEKKLAECELDHRLDVEDKEAEIDRLSIDNEFLRKQLSEK